MPMTELGTLADLHPDPKNARQRTQRGHGMIVRSLQAVGAARSVVVDETNMLLAGHGVTDGAAEIGIDKVLFVDVDGETIVAVRRSGLTPEQKKQLAYYDNRTSELAEWDAAQMVADLELGLNLDDMFKGEELAVILETAADALMPGEPPEPQIDKAEELREQWQTERGQVWEIPSKTVPGKSHRVMCGDSTSAEDVARLFGEQRAKMLWTDPPYGVNYGEKNRYLQSIGRADRLLGDIAGDTGTPEETEAMVRGALEAFANKCNAGAVAYVASPAGSLLPYFISAMCASGFEYKHQLIWLKNQLVFGRCDYMYKHELVLYGWLQNGAHFFEPVTNNCSVFEFDRPRAAKLHPTEKPVELVSAMIQNSSMRGQIVGEPFGGSGTDWVAAEQTGRLCYGMEIEPKYAAVTLQRLVDMGLEPVLVDGN